MSHGSIAQPSKLLALRKGLHREGFRQMPTSKAGKDERYMRRTLYGECWVYIETNNTYIKMRVNRYKNRKQDAVSSYDMMNQLIASGV
jgi:hypothetical protein